jgi:glycosyltransferase involved in cell wall biosynthesis
MNPKISICIPAYKQADKLQVLFQSIQQQTFRDFEVIVTDDSPTDEVEKLCQQQSAFDLKYYKNSVVKGSPENWNIAISLAKGEWIKLIHHDDYFFSNSALQEFVNACEGNPLIDYFFCATNILDSKTNAQFPYVVNLDHVNRIAEHPAFLFHRNLIGAPSTGFFKRALNIKYDKNLIWLVDIEYYSQIMFNSKIQFINKALITTVISEHQLSTGLRDNKEVELREFFYCYIKLIDSFNQKNKKIMRTRLLNLFKEFEILNLSDLKKLNLISPVPLYAKLVLLFLKVNSNFVYRFFYKLNQFNISVSGSR